MRPSAGDVQLRPRWTIQAIVVMFIANCCATLMAYEFGNTRKVEVVCGSMDIRTSVSNLRKLENCTVIEGYLQILLIDNGEPKDYENMTFPNLREVTEYVLLYRASGMKSLGKLFPNLAVIRGKNLVIHYALVVFQMFELQEIGLGNLLDIGRGSVFIRENPSLCYVETIDWDRIAKIGKGTHFIKNNRPPYLCPDSCPEDPSCPVTTKRGEKMSLCWNAHTCQKVCSVECDRQNLTCLHSTQCCHPQCTGGCSSINSSSSCVACQNVVVDGICMKKCPAGTYEYMGRRCISSGDCIAMSKEYNLKPFQGKCLKDCPPGYREDEKDKHVCKTCDGSCPKVCKTGIIGSIGTAQALKGCTTIDGSLDIQILGGVNVQNELEESLSSIEEIKGYLKVARSYPLTTLHFLKNLRVIHGEKLDRGEYSLLVLDNQNLQELWNSDKLKHRLEIKRGKVFFHLNSKLCLNKIEELKKYTSIQRWDDRDVSKSTNGDKIACDLISLNTSVWAVSAKALGIRWNNFKDKLADERALLGYAIHYRESKFQNISKFDDYDACSSNVWKILDVLATNGSSIIALLTHLNPFTQYAFYVSAYTVSSQTTGAQSPIAYAKTLAGTPSAPLALSAIASSHSEVFIKWNRPQTPNGNITHYVVIGKWERDSPSPNESRNYCHEPIRVSNAKKHVNEERTPTKHVWSSTTTKSPLSSPDQDYQENMCCLCEPLPGGLEENSEVEFQIYFENFLHNTVYIKNPSLSPSKERRKRYVLVSNESDIKSTTPFSVITDSPMSSTPQELENTTVVAATTTTIPPNVKRNGLYEEFYRMVNDRYLHMTELRHFSEYIIQVKACRDPKSGSNNSNPCGEETLTSVRTLPLGGADDIDSSSIRVITENVTLGVLVKWNEPPNPNGLIVSYQIEYKKVNGDGYKIDCITQNKYLEHKGYIFTELLAGKYVFRIRATSLAGFGNWTESRNFLVPGSADHSMVTTVLIVIFIPLFLFTTAIALFIYRKIRPKAPKHPNYWTSNPDYMSASDWEILDRWEIPIKEIDILKELGHGAFGKVQEGKWLKSNSNAPIKCAIKTVNESATGSERSAFLREATVMTAFDCHHIVKLLGVVTKTPVPLVLMELMENGDLKTFLLTHRPDSENKSIKPPTIKKRLEMAIQIADGMAYLARKKFVHRDLAARNCMVAADLTVKIGDFGMTRDTYMCDYYRKGDQCRQPVRWMAPESLRDGIFSSQSDVWSYGIVLWEIATLACQPYQGLSNEEVCRFVIEGGTLNEPENCPKQLYSMMELCWKRNPNARPTFINLVEMLIPESNHQFREVSFYFTQYVKEEQESADVDTPLTPLRSPSSENDPSAAEAGSFDDGDAPNYFPGTMAVFSEELEMLNINNQSNCNQCGNGQTCKGDCQAANTSRGLSIHSNDGSKGMSIPSSSGSKESASSGNLANGHVHFPELMTAC